VSAGDSHKIQLPTDSITLYAFVLDDNTGGTFLSLFSCSQLHCYEDFLSVFF